MAKIETTNDRISSTGAKTSVQRLKDPKAVQTAIREFDQLGRTVFLSKYGFGKAREYMVRESTTGNMYDSKAIVGAAYGYAFPDEGPLPHVAFSGGESTVARVLSDLGFEVVRIGQDWSREEVELTVRDYFDMLIRETAGEPYSKSEHNARLRTKLKTRGKSSIELKHQNISAVLGELGLPYVKGYKPRNNVQALLRQEVQQFIQKHGDAIAQVIDNLSAQTSPAEQQYRGVLVEPPKVESLPTPRKGVRLPRKLDYAARDEHNRKLGQAGENWTVKYERMRLTDEGRPDLASRIDWISDRVGDGTGYDIQSFESSELTRFIEVKTTNGGALAPFVISRNELEFSEETGNSFCLYRVFDFSTAPKLFILRGPLSDMLQLEPVDYCARLKSIG
jgi:hypothetical protein